MVDEVEQNSGQSQSVNCHRSVNTRCLGGSTYMSVGISLRLYLCMYVCLSVRRLSLSWSHHISTIWSPRTASTLCSHNNTNAYNYVCVPTKSIRECACQLRYVQVISPLQSRPAFAFYEISVMSERTS